MCATFDLVLAADLPPTTHSLNLAALFEAYPDLRRHRCESGRHRSFETEAHQTETAHLLEHLAVELLVRSGVAREQARGETGIPRDGSRAYRLRLYGGGSLEEMDALLREALSILSFLCFNE